jgi:hypothetical protein
MIGNQEEKKGEERKERENKKETLAKVQEIHSNRISKLQFCLVRSGDKDKGQHQKSILIWRFFKLRRYIHTNVESGVHKASWIDFFCLNAMF